MKTKTIKTDPKPVDDRERREALDPSRSFIVEAPAGSGKTGLLVQRYLKLLSVVNRPECIVAMTFTRKAAAEMKERVLKALEDAATESEARGSYGQRMRELAVAALERDRILHRAFLISSFAGEKVSPPRD